MDWSHTVFLVVDDIEAMRKVISYQLRTLGAAHILTANNGAEALRVLRQQRVDVILSDWNMPVLSGLELLKTLRADEALYRTPFVMITAEAERARVEEAIAHGVSNLLVKPYTTTSLADRPCTATQGRVGDSGSSTASIQIGFEYAFRPATSSTSSEYQVCRDAVGLNSTRASRGPSLKTCANATVPAPISLTCRSPVTERRLNARGKGTPGFTFSSLPNITAGSINGP